MIATSSNFFFNEKLNGTKISYIIKSYIKKSHEVLTFHHINFYTVVKGKIKILRYDIYIKTFDLKSFTFLTKSTLLWELPISACMYIRAYSSCFMRAIVARIRFSFFRIFSNFTHFCSSFRTFCPFLPFFALFLKNWMHALIF